MSDKDRKIIKAAEELFLKYRYHEVTLDQVAHSAGVGKGTIYRYFRNKEDLYYRILLTALDELTESLAQADGDDEAQLIDVVGGMVDFFTRRRNLFALMQSEQVRQSPPPPEVRRQWKEKRETLVKLVTALVREKMESGSYRGNLPPRAAALLLLGMVRSALIHRADMPEEGGVSSQLVELFERGIAAPSDRKTATRGTET